MDPDQEKTLVLRAAGDALLAVSNQITVGKTEGHHVVHHGPRRGHVVGPALHLLPGGHRVQIRRPLESSRLGGLALARPPEVQRQPVARAPNPLGLRGRLRGRDARSYRTSGRAHPVCHVRDTFALFSEGSF